MDIWQWTYFIMSDKYYGYIYSLCQGCMNNEYGHKYSLYQGWNDAII